MSKTHKTKEEIIETYSARVSSKGQVVLPKTLREELAILPGTLISFNVFRNARSKKIRDVKMKKEMNLVELVKSGHFPSPRKNKGVDPVKAREYMEKNYERN